MANAITRTFLTAATIAWTSALPAKADGAGDAVRPIVVEHCAKCHVVPQVNPSERAPMPGAPDFQDIADDRATYSRDRVAAFLRQPHYPMKSVTLSASDIDNLVAYFEGLRGRQR